MWHLPNDLDTRTTRQLVDIAHQHAGHPRRKLRAMPSPVLRALGLVDPTMRELGEMQYQFAEPFVVDSTRFSTVLGLRATPLAEALEATLASYADAADAPAAALVGRRD